MSEMRELSREQALELARAACLGAGASEAMAVSLAEATASAEAASKPSVGFAHLLDYLTSLREGRIDGAAAPAISHPAPAVVAVDVKDGVAQLGFDLAFEDFVVRARRHGVALLALRNSYTTGELGYYARRLAERGLVSLAATNGPPLMAPPGARQPVYCTNPLAFAAPGESGPALLIDQATSATAFVKVREAAKRGETLPEGWAIDAAGAPTVDPAAALGGALLTFGGPRGANIALMVEVLAAGLTGANWSLDAPSFRTGDQNPGAGLLVIAIAAKDLGEGFASRLEAQTARLQGLGVHIPGHSETRRETFTLPASLIAEIAAFARRD